jgi:hypothetical protein
MYIASGVGRLMKMEQLDKCDFEEKHQLRNGELVMTRYMYIASVVGRLIKVEQLDKCDFEEKHQLRNGELVMTRKTITAFISLLSLFGQMKVGSCGLHSVFVSMRLCFKNQMKHIATCLLKPEL